MKHILPVSHHPFHWLEINLLARKNMYFSVLHHFLLKNR